MKLPKSAWQKQDGMADLMDVLGGGHEETRFVGGCVRDTLLDLAVSDVDLATRLRPYDVMKRLTAARIKAVPTGISHGTITAVVGGRPIEVTTLRRDVTTDGRRATIAFTDDWREDAARRDFTINALSANPDSLEIHDYFGGIEDLHEGCVRFIGTALERIAEDHLRILRFFRFHARFGRGAPDIEALEACTARANDLMALSRERIADELIKLLALPSPHHTVTLMVQRSIFAPVLPEIVSESVDQLAQLIEREQQAGIEPDPLRRLAALLPADPEIAQSVAARLRLSKKASRRLVTAADRSDPLPPDPQPLAYRLGVQEAEDRLLLANHVDGRAAKLAMIAGWTRPRLGISGGDLIALGVPEGPSVAKLLRAIENEWVTNGFPGASATEQIARRHVDAFLNAAS